MRTSKNHSNVSKEKVPFVFGEEEEEEEEHVDAKKAESSRVEAMLSRQREAEEQERRKYEEMAMEDPSIFQYDEIYDEMKVKTVKPRVEERKPRYVDSLLDRAKEREKEREIVLERKIAKEIEKEAEIYGDVERFVTSGYKRKLEERQAWVDEADAEDEKKDRKLVLQDKSRASSHDLAGTKHLLAPQPGRTNDRNQVDVGGTPRVEAATSKSQTKGFAPMGDPKDTEEDVRVAEPPSKLASTVEDNQSNPDTLSPEALREKKIREARERYLMRRSRLESKALTSLGP